MDSQPVTLSSDSSLDALLSMLFSGPAGIEPLSISSSAGTVVPYYQSTASRPPVRTPSYPCELEIEEWCSGYSSRGKIETCLAAHHDELSMSCHCFLAQSGVEMPGSSKASSKPLASPRLHTVTPSIAKLSALVRNHHAHDADDDETADSHSSASHVSCLLSLFASVLLVALVLRRCALCCAAPRPAQFAAVVAPPKSTKITSTVEPLVLAYQVDPLTPLSGKAVPRA